MGKRHLNDDIDLGPSRKKALLSDEIHPHEILTDITGKQWKLGHCVGEGAFGRIYLASDDLCRNVDGASEYVAKIELHSNGPLFVEVNFYLRAAKLGMLNEWKQKRRQYVGLPHYVASGSHTKQSLKYRFLIIPRYSIDLQKVLSRLNNRLNIKTVLTIGVQVLSTLKYIHHHGFIHADIKAANIMLNRANATTLRGGRLSPKQKIVPAANRVYLLDFGLASKYRRANGEHREYTLDARKAHAGTILFCSLDAHNGVQTRRSDLECLGYNMVHWLTGSLPWMHDIEDYELVKRKKQCVHQDVDHFLRQCFGGEPPGFLQRYFTHVNQLAYDGAPNYAQCRNVLMRGFTDYGYKKTLDLDFENKQGNGVLKHSNCENLKRKKAVAMVCASPMVRTPLKSNLPVLRRVSKLKERALRWSTILIDPELIMKEAARERDHDDTWSHSDVLENMDIHGLNPTGAMMDVYNHYFERQRNAENGSSPRHSSGDAYLIEGYNAAMMGVHMRMMEQRRAEMANKRMLARKKPKKRTIYTKSNAAPPADAPAQKRYLTRRTCRTT